MEGPIGVLHARVKDHVSEREFAARVEKARSEFAGLLDDEALGLLVLDELGLNEGAYVTLADLAGRAEATVRARVERIEPARTFERPGRDPGRVANALVSDATAEARVVFWDKDVDRLEDGQLGPGAHVTIVNARVKKGPFGVELHVGPWTRLEVEGALDPARRKLLADVAPEGVGVRERVREGEGGALPTVVEGTLAWVGPTRPYRKADGSTGFSCEIDLETLQGPMRVVAWDDRVRDVRGVRAGERVRIGPVTGKVKGATTEFHADAATRVERLP